MPHKRGHRQIPRKPRRQPIPITQNENNFFEVIPGEPGYVDLRDEFEDGMSNEYLVELIEPSLSKTFLSIRGSDRAQRTRELKTKKQTITSKLKQVTNLITKKESIKTAHFRLVSGLILDNPDLNDIETLQRNNLVKSIKRLPKIEIHNGDAFYQSKSFEVNQGIDLPRGLDGTNVKVGVLDSGLDMGLLDFLDENGNSRVVFKRNYVYDSTSIYYITPFDSGDVRDYGGHGTHVMGTVAGSPIYNENGEMILSGMAPKAQLHVFKAGNKSSLYGYALLSAFEDAVDLDGNCGNHDVFTGNDFDEIPIDDFWFGEQPIDVNDECFEDRIDVLNNSWGSGPEHPSQTWAESVVNDMIDIGVTVVFSAGNNSDLKPIDAFKDKKNYCDLYVQNTDWPLQEWVNNGYEIIYTPESYITNIPDYITIFDNDLDNNSTPTIHVYPEYDFTNYEGAEKPIDMTKPHGSWNCVCDNSEFFYIYETYPRVSICDDECGVDGGVIAWFTGNCGINQPSEQGYFNTDFDIYYPYGTHRKLDSTNFLGSTPNWIMAARGEIGFYGEVADTIGDIIYENRHPYLPDGYDETGNFVNQDWIDIPYTHPILNWRHRMIPQYAKFILFKGKTIQEWSEELGTWRCDNNQWLDEEAMNRRGYDTNLVDNDNYFTPSGYFDVPYVQPMRGFCQSSLIGEEHYITDFFIEEKLWDFETNSPKYDYPQRYNHTHNIPVFDDNRVKSQGDGDSFNIGCPGCVERVITVGAIAKDYFNSEDGVVPYFNSKFQNPLVPEALTHFSSRGPVWPLHNTVNPNYENLISKPDIVAPGLNICSAGTRYGKTNNDFEPVQTYDECGTPNHRIMSGTSMSSPVVTGTIALLIDAANRNQMTLTPDEIKEIIKGSARIPDWDWSNLNSECSDEDMVNRVQHTGGTFKYRESPYDTNSILTNIRNKCGLGGQNQFTGDSYNGTNAPKFNKSFSVWLYGGYDYFFNDDYVNNLNHGGPVPIPNLYDYSMESWSNEQLIEGHHEPYGPNDIGSGVIDIHTAVFNYFQQYELSSDFDYNDYEIQPIFIGGCTNPSSPNYNPNVDFDSCRGCTDVNALNYEITANIDNGTCEYLDSDGDGIPDYLEIQGCTDVEALNYDENATDDDGSCEYIEGCTDENAFNYDLTAQINDGTCFYEDPLYPIMVFDNNIFYDGVTTFAEYCPPNSLYNRHKVANILASYPGDVGDIGSYNPTYENATFLPFGDRYQWIECSLDENQNQIPDYIEAGKNVIEQDLYPIMVFNDFIFYDGVTTFAEYCPPNSIFNTLKVGNEYQFNSGYPLGGNPRQGYANQTSSSESDTYQWIECLLDENQDQIPDYVENEANSANEVYGNGINPFVKWDDVYLVDGNTIIRDVCPPGTDYVTVRKNPTSNNLLGPSGAYPNGGLGIIASGNSPVSDLFTENMDYIWVRCEYPPIYGCTDSIALNYNTNATIDDGSCIYLSGDANFDNNLSVSDAVIIVQKILETSEFIFDETTGQNVPNPNYLSGEEIAQQFPEMDYNGDGAVNILDVQLLIQDILNQPTTTSGERRELQRQLNKLTNVNRRNVRNINRGRRR